ncbi:hypothetical protein EBE87_03870 [Pseudoroseomonas wenyumeiae]|uniref:Uncharacterized protein n=2 Tax=Teichococcus wenyumeiae TaxID=2478470 RepID=A0ABX9VNT6_9PROT|nr:hypothetical protein [Pseudoroseomonas wenyumeiae]RMI26424.1 hypothetical protein EBE87_03870 [Pseudoroseomonas wenyumeiae]
MRTITLCLLGLFALALSAPVSAEASSTRSGPRAGAKVVKPTARAAAPARTAATATRRQVAVTRAAPARQTARATTSRQTAKAGGRVGAVQRSQGPVVAQRSNMTARGARLTSWTAGLPAASGEQRDCPVGTMSTLARGHDDVIRCMPL